MTRRILLALAFLGLFGTVAQAHKVNVFAVVENGFVTGEGYFSGGAKAQNSTVEIRNATADLIAQGVTGTDGTFRVALPSGAEAPLTVVLKAGEGHQSTFILKTEDLGQTKSTQAPTPAGMDWAQPSAPVGAGAIQVMPPGKASGVPASTVLPAMDETRLAALMDAAVAKAVTPLRLELAKLADRDQGAQFQGIIGGLGWIIGLVGIAAWFKRPRP